MTMLMRSQETFWAPKDRLVRTGDMLALDDPVIEGREHLFSPVSAPAASDPELLGRMARLEAALEQALTALAAQSNSAEPAGTPKPSTRRAASG